MTDRRVCLLMLVLAATAGAPAAQTPNQVPQVITTDTVYLAGERIVIDRTYPPTPESSMSVPIDVQILRTAEIHPSPAVRAAAVRVIGRFETPGDVERLVRHIGDPAAVVRQETARAIAQSLVGATLPQDSKAIALAFDVLRGHLRFERIRSVASAMLEAIGVLPLGPEQSDAAEQILLNGARPSPPLLGALRGLEALLRRNPDRPVADATRERLRQLVVPRTFGVEGDIEPWLPAIQALYAIRDTDVRTITAAAAYRCPPPSDPECGWDIRRVAVMMMNGAAARFSQALDYRLKDAHHLVRMEALRVLARAIPDTKSCHPLIYALADSVRHVVITAIDLMDPQCMERDAVAARLLDWAVGVADSRLNSWHEPAQALVALTKFLPDEARRLATEKAAVHGVWQVRATAARVARLLRDESLAQLLTKDAEPNVRTEALNALVEIGSASRVAAALEALESPDYQLVLTAATLLKKSRLGPLAASGLGDAGVPAMLAALRRLTDDDHDMARDPRLELLARLSEWGEPADETLRLTLRPYLRDVDPAVAAAAADALGVLSGTRPAPEPTRQMIEQPTETELQNMRRGPQVVEVRLEDGSSIAIRLQPNEAPLTIARFLKLVQTGYYRGLAFHRVVPDLVVQGGSPGANEYSGVKRIWTDEIGLLGYEAGVVGLSTRGRHTGNAQFFIAAVAAPGLDHKYTIFGRACVPRDLLEGALMTDVTIAPRPVSGGCR